MKEKIEQETNLTLLGQVLIEMGECNQALKYSEQMMHKAFDIQQQNFPPNYPDICEYYNKVFKYSIEYITEKSSRYCCNI